MSFVKDVVSSFFGGDEKEAAAAAAAGQTEAIEEQRRQSALTRGDIAPELEAGGLGRERLLEFLGLRGAEAEQAAISGFQESPGQAFLRERAERTRLRTAAATGELRGGNVQRQLQEESIGLTNQFLGERLDRLAGVARGGREALGLQVGAGAGTSANIAELLAGRGETRATGIRGRAAGIRSGLGRVAGAFTGTGALSRFNPLNRAPVAPRPGVGGI